MTFPDFLASFVPQLLATVVGALIGLYAVRLAFRWQRRADAETGVEAAAEMLLQRIGEHVTAADAYHRDYQMTNWHMGQRPQRVMPHAASVSIAVELLRVRTGGEDREVADAIGTTWNAVAHASLDSLPTACGVLAGAIAAWRRGEPRATVISSLETARQLALPEDEVEVSPDED